MADKSGENNSNVAASSASNISNDRSGVKDFAEGAKGVADGNASSNRGSSKSGVSEGDSGKKSGNSVLGNIAKNAASGVANKIPIVNSALAAKKKIDDVKDKGNQLKNKVDGAKRKFRDLKNGKKDDTKGNGKIGRKFNPLGGIFGKLGLGKDKDDEKESSTDGDNNTDNVSDGENEGTAVDTAGTEQVKAVAKVVVSKVLFLVVIVCALVAAIFIIVGLFISIMLLIFGDTSNKNSNNNVAESDVAGNGTCTYNVGGKTVSDLKVNLLKCEGNASLGEPLVDFEDYIAGVVYQEVNNVPYEAMKAQAIAARSYALRRPDVMGGKYGLSLKKDKDGQWVLSLRSCTNDQAFCNVNKGCWSLRTGGQTSNSNPGDWPNCTIHSGEDKTKPWSRPLLPQDNKIRQAVEETKGMILENSKGEVVSTNFNNSNQQKWISMAQKGKKAFDILTKEYGSHYRISTPNCTSGAGVSGDVASIIAWDQKTAWKNLIGISTDDSNPSVGESTVSGRITTIEVPVRKWSGSGSNPRTDTKKGTAKIRVNEAIAPLWQAFFEDVYNNAPDFIVDLSAGCYNYRPKTSGNGLSAHAYGVACDVNASVSGNGYNDHSLSKEDWEKLPESQRKYQIVYKGSKVVQIAHKYTLLNGSDWNNPHDAMHFSFIADGNSRDYAIKCQNKVSCK